MKKLILFFVIIMMAIGCETVQPQQTAPTKPSIAQGTCVSVGQTMVFCNNYIVNFISDPVGAKIELANNYVGITPCSTRFDGYYATDSIRMVNAYPALGGQFLQRKMFGWGEFYPQTMYFDMDLGPATPSLDVNVN